MLSKTREKKPRPPKPGPTGVKVGEASARAMVLRGAANVLAERGVRSATVEDILESSGISRRTFYRLYESKEDVVVALYRLGTQGLIEACRLAIAKECDPLRQVEGCIDAHLRNAREVGRLVYVLGGEAQRGESQLKETRREAHSAVVALLSEGLARAGKAVDPLLLRGLVLALEGITRILLEEGDAGHRVTPGSLERARRVVLRMATATLAGEGPGVTPLPALE